MFNKIKYILCSISTLALFFNFFSVVKAQTQDTYLYISPSQAQTDPSSTFTFSVNIDKANNLGGYELTLSYEPRMLTLIDIQTTNFLASTGRTVNQLGPNINEYQGTATIGQFSLGSTPLGPNGQGTLVTATFKPVQEGQATIMITSPKITDIYANPIVPPTQNINITISSSITPTKTPSPTPTATPPYSAQCQNQSPCDPTVPPAQSGCCTQDTFVCAQFQNLLTTPKCITLNFATLA